MSKIHTPKTARTALATAALIVLAACGGGGGGGSDDDGGDAAPQSFSTGKISGFGSIIVNGVRFDDSQATVLDDDGEAHDRGELGLGMVVEVEGGAVQNQAGTASKIVMRSEIKGPVEAVDAAAGALTVLGQRVLVGSQTAFEGVTGGLAGLQVGDTVEVHAFFDAKAGVYTATRIEAESDADRFKLRGAVSGLDTAARTFRIGDALIDYSQVDAGRLPALADGALVRVKLQTTQVGGAWVATKIDSGRREVAEHAETEAEGFVSDFASLASFRVNGLEVDASGASVRFEDGTAADVANGVRVEVEGEVSGGVLIARKLEIKDRDSRDGHDDEDEHEGSHEFELHGQLAAAPSADHRFVLRGVTVQIGAQTVFEDGSATDLQAGARIEVEGRLVANGTLIEATKIGFEDRDEDGGHGGGGQGGGGQGGGGEDDGPDDHED